MKLAPTVAMLLVCATLPANAYRLSLTTGYAGQVLSPGETIRVDLQLDTEGASSIDVFEMGVVFDTAAFQHRDDLYAVASHVLFSPNEGKGRPSVYLAPSIPNADVWPIGSGSLRHIRAPFRTAPSLGLLTRAASSDAWIATFGFEVLGCPAGQTICTVNLTIDPTFAGAFFTIGTHGGADRQILTDEIGVGPPIAVLMSPEPGTGVLVGIGLVALARAARRGRGSRVYSPCWRTSR